MTVRRRELAPGKRGFIHSRSHAVPRYILSSELSFLDASSAVGSEEHTDPKRLRKLRQQQLQQKFRKEMEARKLQQEQGQTKELAIGRGGSGGNVRSSFSEVIS